ncbi:hypothetical protein [Epibacterium ulvae]|uniref:hypothetical protein n=1 Tax=Epibacterium ulvae TaxID=1156985 RepID=UPI00249181CD|nr:hypothetical protein [Epibacterium ulvae]
MTLQTSLLLRRRFTTARLNGVSPVSALPNPIEGWVSRSSLAPGSDIETRNLFRDRPAVFAADFIGLDGSSGGVIAEFGGITRGACCGFRANGDFVVRCGSGATLPNNNAASFVISDHGISGDGTLVVAFDIGAVTRVRAWWERRLVGEGVAINGQAFWAGEDKGTYLGEGRFSTIAGEFVSAAVPYLTASPVRYYADRTIAG